MSDETGTPASVEGPADLDASASIAPAVIRTVVPMLVTLLTSWLARNDVVVDGESQAALVGVISLIVGTGYYTLVRELERRWPKAGWLLGSPHAPVYPSKDVPVAVEPDAEGGTNG